VFFDSEFNTNVKTIVCARSIPTFRYKFMDLQLITEDITS